MADYISILDKAVSGLAENTPENRVIIFEKARAAIERKLRAMDPVPPEEAIARQLTQLEAAITEVDAKYAFAASSTSQPEPIVEPVSPAIEQPAAVQPITVPAGFVDDIILIDGIGEKTVSLLADEGVTGISQIAAMSDEQLAVLTEKIGFKGFEVTQEWKLQATEMLSGGLPRSKTDQTRLAKLKEAGSGDGSQQTVADSQPAAPMSPPVEPQVPATPEPSIPAPAAPAPSSLSPEVTTPSVTEPIVHKPVLDNSNVAPQAPVSPTPVPPTPTALEPGQPVTTPAETIAPAISAPPAPSTGREDLEAQLDALAKQQHANVDVAAPVEQTPQAPEPAFVSELENDPGHSPANDPYLERSVYVEPPKKGGAGKAIATGSILLILGAAAAGAYVYKDTLLDLGNKGVVAVKELMNTNETAVEPATDAAETTEEPAAVETTEETPSEETTPETKDASRLGSDGTESLEPVVNEPEPVTEPDPVIVPEPITTPRIVDPETPATVEVEEEAPSEAETGTETEATETAETETPAVEEATPQPVAINGEKSFLYEEALGTTGANRDEGSISWSLVTEAPEPGAAPEAVIKAVLEIPSRGLMLNMAIKRNIDAGLPASHIIELFFSAPGEFSGGNIDNVSRFVMKSTEQARGESLVGVPARIDAGFFLIALNNLEQAQKTNLSLLENSDWVDIPVSYVTGRRALLTFEKGESGKEVFAQALADWKNR